MFTKKYKLYFNHVKEYLNEKYFSLLTIVMFLLCSIQFFSYKPMANFWINFFYSIGNGMTNTLFFCVLIINFFIFRKELKSDVFLFNRIGNYKDKVKCDLFSIVVMNSILFLVFMIINLAYAILESSNNYNIMISDYGIILPLQIIIEVIKYYLYVILISSLVGLISNVKNKILCTALLLLIFIITVIPVSHNHIVESIFDLSIQYMFYISNLKFASLGMDIFFTIINLLFFLIIDIFLYKRISNKKADV